MYGHIHAGTCVVRLAVTVTIRRVQVLGMGAMAALCTCTTIIMCDKRTARHTAVARHKRQRDAGAHGSFTYYHYTHYRKHSVRYY